ncbi:hypothetical protein SAMN05444358_11171 [Ruegeria halocynthiae]|uniref:SMP-30/Gluconolaconase/LRE-like region-containing protein n=1 Tax=Ruegeria halocynthiae TaxID=985054 RepID=A0A1H3EHE5_9RHOB|nr:hypothetical protein [Ruegeria halocynthiae]SDX78183.1 hypothetical protein SAMN05444358_11171 [Ruegeria halocynthiae]
MTRGSKTVSTSRLLAIAATFSVASMAQASDLPPPEGLDQIVDDGAKWEHIHSAQCFTEGIAHDADGNVFFSDIASTADC